jgi:hypothetical protein
MPCAAWSLVACSGPVSTAVGRLAVEAKASVIGSECWNGESVNSKRGWQARSTARHAS